MADGKVVISTALDNKGLEKGLSSVTGKLGGLTKTVGKLTLAITAAFAATAVAVTKQAVDAYADYEQLAGGINTMFKESAQKVLQYAEDAFYTAGVSANEYMSIVTDFSNSLISSLEGDTEKAADVANMALIDMSDNVNKIGSSLESVQLAYKSFARQQYLLLDNLKLGYGGTKAEMQRLLKDAEAYSGVKYDINNLSDVYTAIHKIQEKLGIAGTTAEEAEKTITGSAKMTKAAWQNVLAAISGGGDIDRAINNLVYSVTRYFENIVPVVERSIKGIGQLIEKIAPQLVQTVASALIKALPSLVNAVWQMFAGLAKGIQQGIVSLFTGGGGTTEVSAELNNVASGYGAAADGANDLADATEEAGKAAKKTLAGFDELNTLAAPNSGSSEDSLGTSSSVGGGLSAGSITIGGEVNDELAPQFKAIIEGVKKYLEPLQAIDFSAAKESLLGLKEEFQGLADVLGGVFSWVWFNILVPLAQWTIEEAAPAAVDALGAALEGVAATIQTIFNALKGAWSSLQPIINWIKETVLVVLEDLKEIGQRVAQKWKENEPKIKKTFENIGKVVEKIWSIVGPILTWIRDGLSQIATDTPITDLQYIIDLFYGLSEILAGIFSLDIGQVFNGYGALVEGELNRAKESLRTYASALGIDVDALEQKISDWATGVGDTFSGAWDSVKEVWGNVTSWFDENVIQPVKDAFAPIGEWFGELWAGVEQTFSDVFYNIGVIAEGCWETIKIAWELATQWFDENIIQPVSEFFDGLWEDVSTWASDAWKEIKETIQPYVTWIDENVIQPISTFFSDMWDDIELWAAEAVLSIQKFFSGIGTFFKNILNGIITVLNRGLSWIFGGINKLLTSLKELNVAGSAPFANIKTVSVPQIPYLAQGAVLPANKPFMAVVGDQRHGTNVEAPLTTIQEALALVMEDYVAADLAGHQATVSVLREILEAVLGIHIGDDVIASAVSRYQSKMAVVRGG